MAKFLEDQYSLSEASLWLDRSSSYLRGLSARTSVFIDSSNPPLTPTYKFPRLTRLNCPAALNPQPPSNKGHRICKPPWSTLPFLSFKIQKNVFLKLTQICFHSHILMVRTLCLPWFKRLIYYLPVWRIFFKNPNRIVLYVYCSSQT